MLRVIGYTRVSTERQARDGLSLDAQSERIRAYCAAYGYELVRIVMDHKSGESLNRPGIKECLAALRSGEAAGMVVYKLDRITRKLADLCSMTDEYFGDGKPYTLMSVSEHIDTSTPNGRMMMHILGSFGQFERELISERTKEAATYWKQQGKRWGGIPFGFDVADDGETLVKNEREQEVLSAILTLHRGGKTLRAIAAELNRRKVPTKKSGSWTHTVVKSILQRAAA